ncbi:MAG: aminopeptidase P family protein, partial [Rhodospirillaceae bacterium]|nr:aminopeptidase P family protein [Rhodospirillaceae bacterium]
FLAWLTGYDASGTRYRALLVACDGEPVLVDRTLDAAPYLEVSPYNEHVSIDDSTDMLGAVVATMQARGGPLDRVGIDGASYNLHVTGFRALEAALPATTWVDLSDDLEALRWIKSPAEIERLRHASGIADTAMAETIASAAPGMTERDAAVTASSAFVRLGADRGECGPITAGTGWDFLHGHTHDRPLEQGDVLHMELVPWFGGYSARLMRNCIIGPPSDEQQAIADRLIALQDEQIAAMTVGASAGAIDHIVREPILAEGLRETFDNVSGYTLGHYPRFSPVASDFSRCFLPESDWELEAGMTFHMYLSARGLAISETVVVTSDGPERLTRIERRLFHT